jgi:hypothetical protein
MNKGFTRIASVAICVTAAALFTQSAAGQLIGFYEFEGNGNDSSGQGNHATVVGTPFSAMGNGLFGDYAFENNGSGGQYLHAPLNLSPGIAGQVTMGGWININSTGYQTMLQADGWYGRKLVIDDRGLYEQATGSFNYATHSGRSIGVAEDDWHIVEDGYRFGKRNIVAGAEASASDGWVFFAATYDARRGETIIYNDSTIYKQVDAYAFSATGRSTLHIGSIQGNWENLNGQMDNVFVFDGALTPSQMASLRNATDPLATAQAIGADLATGKSRTWKVDFQPTDQSQPFGTGVSADGSNGESWNVINVGTQGVNKTNFSTADMVDTLGNGDLGDGVTPDFQLNGTIRPYSYGAGGDAAAGDYIYWGGDAHLSGLSESLTWSVSDLDPDKYYRFVPIGGGVTEGYELDNERRRFTMAIDSNGDGSTDTTRLVKVGRGAHMGLVAKPSVSGTIVGATGHGGDVGKEANWGGFMLEELGSADDDKFKLRCSPRHRYSFNIDPQLGASVVYDSVSGAHGTTYDTDGITVVSDLQLGDGTMDLSFEPQGGPWGLAKLPTTVMDDKIDISIETWFTYTGMNGDFTPSSTVLWRFEGSGGERFEQMATGSKISPYSFSPDFYHNVRLSSLEGSTDADLFTGDNRWANGDEQHIVVTLETGAGTNNTNILSYYLNGMLVKQSLTDVNLSDIDFTELLLGGLPGVAQQFSNGIWEEFRIYDFALTENEVLGNWMNGADALNVMQYMLGDVDGDGDVDNVDIGIATGNFTGAGGSTAMIWCDGDMDGDGDIDNQDIGMITGAFTGAVSLAEFNSIQAATGLTAAELADRGIVAVPEPATLFLLGLGGLAVIRRKQTA